MTKLTITLAAILFLGGAVAFGQAPLAKTIPNPTPPPGGWSRLTFHIPHVDVPPKIDGVLDDPCWKTALHADSFFRWQSKDPVKEQTEAWICADDKNMYFAFHCLDSSPGQIKASETQREGNISHDDFVMIGIDTEGTRRNISQWQVSASGTQVTQLEAGSADNLKWSGDWHAATKRTSDGWTAEVAIPFEMMKYPKGTKSFPLILLRQLARETNGEYWPYVPDNGFGNPMPYFHDFLGVTPPTFAPKVVFLPYELGTLNTRAQAHYGLDVKYPLTTTLSAVGTLYPDFQTVENAVSDLSFSYTEKYVPDRRPFFVEGSNYFSDASLFYSQRIPMVDEGLRLVGKEGPTTIGVLGSNTAQAVRQRATYTSLDRELGDNSSVGGSFLSNHQDDMPDNEVSQIRGSYGWVNGRRRTVFNGSYTQSWTTGVSSDHSASFNVGSFGGPGVVNGNVYYNEIGANFNNELGLIGDLDQRGYGASTWRNNNYDHGPVEFTNFSLWTETYRHLSSGAFFHDMAQASVNVNMRNGWSYGLSTDAGKRDDYHDNTVSGNLGWNQKSLLDQGNVNLQVGRRLNMPYDFLSISQGVRISKAVSIQLGFNRVTVNGSSNTQTVASGTYRLSGDQSIGGRLVQQGNNVNAYLSYGKHGRNGRDFFVLIGDPNSLSFSKSIAVKLVEAF